ncbi:putative FHA domain-containing protein [Gammaproteobacteria bacterium]
MAQLTLTFSGRVVGTYAIDRDRLTIGRRPNSHLYIDNLAVSGEHCVINRTNEGYVLEDRGSTNGTYVNEAPVQRHLLCPGDVIRIGRHELLYADSPTAQDPTKTELPSPKEQSPKEQKLDASMASGPVFPLLRPAAIRVLNGSRKNTVLPLDHTKTRLGRPGSPNATIFRTADGYVVSGTESSGVILVNDQPISKSGKHLLENRDVVEISGFQVEFYYLS